jgi:hypothetical protein
MTEYLIASRAAIIFWTSLAAVPAEILFDAIQTELEGPAAGAREKDGWSPK